ncbi:MAG: hypothetical protein EOP52_13885 [Sphingobacteriales bacterium]|nr:MAG: hypothetical protein EOP52_13885 [Sphingobacteriales bacterium]
MNTPLNPKGWNINFDGETVTLSPSVGNWNIPCRSHYIIDRSRVIECGEWSPAQAQHEQIRTQKALAQHFDQQQEVSATVIPAHPPTQTKLTRIINFMSNIWK